MLCECSQMDWHGVDMSAEHHPECEAVRRMSVLTAASLLGPAIPIQAAVMVAMDSTARAFNGSSSHVDIVNPPTEQVAQNVTFRYEVVGADKMAEFLRNLETVLTGTVKHKSS